MPTPPKVKTDGKWEDYERSFKNLRREAYKRMWELEYELLMASGSAKEFFFLFNEVRVRDLAPFVLKAIFK